VNSYVALLRGINVGGNNILPMKDFRDLLTALGCEDVATYIQSGNAVFKHVGKSAELSDSIAVAIESGFGFQPSVMVLTATEFATIVANCPFPPEDIEPKFLHVSFLREVATATNTERLEEIASSGEEFLLTDSAFYLYAPNGVGRSKLASEVEKCLGVPATARNWRTVSKIAEMLSELD
jgi:uncharacterized protein (DUF1697 family)